MSVDFLDSNVFVYLFDETSPRKRRIATDLVHRAVESGGAVISHQVVQEVLNVLTRKIETPMTSEDAQRFLNAVLAPLWRVMPTPRLYGRALDLQARHRYAFYDSLILAAALDAGCDRLLTEDMHDGHRIEGLTLENPFAS